MVRRCSDASRFLFDSSATDCKFAVPVVSNVDTAAKPNPLEATHVLEQPDEARATSRSADGPIMQPYGEKLGRALRTLAIKHIERISHVGEKMFAGREAAILIETVVVCFVRVRNNQVMPIVDPQRVWECVRKRVAIV